MFSPHHDVSPRAVKQREEPAIHSLPQKKCMLRVNTGLAPDMNDGAGQERRMSLRVRKQMLIVSK